MIIYYFLLTLMPLERHPLWVGTLGDVTLIKYVGALAALYAVVYAAFRNTTASCLNLWPVRLFSMYVLLAFASYISVGDYQQLQQSPLFTYLSISLMFIVTIIVVDNTETLRRVLYTVIGSLAVASLYVIRDWQKYHGVYAGYRPSGVVGDPNYFALSALLCAPLALYLSCERRTIWEKSFLLVSLGLIGTAVTLGASRGGLLGIGAVCLVIIARSRRPIRNVLIAAILVIPPNLIMPTSPLRRMLTPTHADEQGKLARQVAWRAGLRMIQSSPLTGVGFAQFKPRVLEFESADDPEIQSMAHNTYIEVAAELGVPGFILYFLTFVCAFRMLNHVRVKARDRLLRLSASGMQAGFAGAATAAIFLSAEFQKLPWVFLIFAVTIKCLCPSPKKARSSTHCARNSRDSALRQERLCVGN